MRPFSISLEVVLTVSQTECLTSFCTIYAKRCSNCQVYDVAQTVKFMHNKFVVVKYSFSRMGIR